MSPKLLMSSLVAAALLTVFTGCQTTSPEFQPIGTEGPKLQPQPHPQQSEVTTLREGDTLRIEFPGAPNLNTRRQIRADVKIELPLVGEVMAAGKTPDQLEKELLKLYGPQIISKEITVAVDSTSFPVFVSGAVLRPGKITSDRPLTALEAVMDAGVDYSKAQLKAVKVIRNTNGRVEHITLDLDRVIKGKAQEVKPFYLKPSDIVFVPERFQWF